MGRILIALTLLASTNWSVQKMKETFKIPVNVVIYASLCLALFGLSGCATMADGSANVLQGMGDGLQASHQRTRNCRAIDQYYNNGMGEVYKIKCN